MTLTYDCTDLWSESFILFSWNGRSLVAHIVVKILKTLRKILGKKVLVILAKDFRKKILVIPAKDFRKKNSGDTWSSWSPSSCLVCPCSSPVLFSISRDSCTKVTQKHKSHSVYLVFLVNNIFQIRILFIWFVFNRFLLMMCTIAKMYDPTIILEKEPIKKGMSMQCAIEE